MNGETLVIDFSYLGKGICGLANAHKASALAGHLGAAVAAGYFFGEDQADLDNDVYRGVEKELDRITHGEESLWFNSKKAGITSEQLFEPLPEEKPQPELISTIGEALSKNIDQTRESGHNVIFASIALRALHDHTNLATPTAVQGIRKLIEGFNHSHPGRGYFGKEQGWLTGDKVSLPAAEALPVYANTNVMAETVIDELIATAAIRRQGFGGLWHIINHAAALMELSRFGFKDLAQRGLAAHHHHLRLWRSLPDVANEMGAVQRAAQNPCQPEYWKSGMLKRDEARLTHRIKTMYGFYVVLRQIDNQQKRMAAEKSLLYLMA